MKTRLVKPPDIPDSEIKKLEDALIAFLWEELYKPLVDVVPALDKKSINNSKDDVLNAIKSGRIVFYRGEFKGTFTARLSRGLKSLGAKWDRKQGSWKILLNSLPQDFQDAIRLSENAFNQTFIKFNTALSSITPDQVASKVQVTDLFDKMLFNLDGRISKQISGITVNVDLTKAEKLKIAEEYNNNMQLYIKDFTEKQITTLRDRVQKNYYSGNRYENLIEDIQKNFKVTKNKAKFLARQETNLIQAKYKEVRYRSSGSPGYYWRSVKGTPKHPVRPRHKELDGQYIRWDNPPVVDLKTGARGHAGTPYNCRCTPQIVLIEPDNE